MRERRLHDWARIRWDYELGADTLAALCAKHGCSMSALGKRARAEGWTTRKERRSLAMAPERRRADLVGRLYAILTEEVRLIALDLASAGGGQGQGGMAAGERRLKSLHTAVRSLDALAQAEERGAHNTQGEGAGPGDNHTEADAERLRRDIARRIQRLRDRGEGRRDRNGAHGP